jgi:hypothetical protein
MKWGERLFGFQKINDLKSMVQDLSTGLVKQQSVFRRSTHTVSVTFLPPHFSLKEPLFPFIQAHLCPVKTRQYSQLRNIFKPVSLGILQI